MPMQVKIIGKDDIEGLNYLAEEILMQLRFEGYRFDNEGNDRFPYDENHSNSEARHEAMLVWMETLKHDHPLEFRDNSRLHGIAFGEALEMSFSEIAPNSS